MCPLRSWTRGGRTTLCPRANRQFTRLTSARKWHPRSTSLSGKTLRPTPFREARVEGFGTTTGRRKRKDLRFYGANGKLLLCGEVKLPGTPEGQSAFADKLMQDAFSKAENAGVRYFFTWNVNEFAIFDRKLWDRPLLERRVRPWRLGRYLPDSAAVAREDNLRFIKTHFLPDLLHDLADIISGRRAEWLPPDDIFIRSLESHLNWPVQLCGPYILQEASNSKTFDMRVQALDEGPRQDVYSHAGGGMGEGSGQHGQDVGVCLGKPPHFL